MLMLARLPEFGGVKTRLARHVGAAQALSVHVELLRRNATIAAQVGVPFELHYAGDLSSDSGFFRALATELGAELVPQVAGDIGAKMLAAAGFRTQPSVLIGADCGDLSVAYLQSAVVALREAPVVLGPAEDGGYVLVAQREPMPVLFTGIDWGTDRVLAQTRKNLGSAGVVCIELPVRWDVDGVVDWRRYRQAQ